ncbi:glycosyltransferase family 2 protein, partial [Methanocella conradii]|uniref:glycosyltransferase family 2 protein n=1 Tax=Methanocella conradii TaxID=1175444 RepID=UPI0024B328C7
DGSVVAISEAFPNVTLVENGKNLGFAAGNNVGIRLALKGAYDYVLLLNNDTVVDPCFLRAMVATADADPAIGIVGPKIYYYDDPKRIWFAGGHVNHWLGETSHVGQNELDDGRYDVIKDTDFITGCALLIKRKALEEIGLLDERMGFYFEDNDLCARARKRGYRIVYVPEAKIWHKVASSAGKVNDLQLFYFTRNRLIFMRRYANRLQFAVFLPYYILRYVMLKLAIALIQLKLGQAKLILRAVYEGATT